SPTSNPTIFLPSPPPHSHPHSFPTRRSSDLKPVFSAKKVTWEQVESEEYLKYIESLRAVGCPEEKVRYIILADINELFAKKRIRSEEHTSELQSLRHLVCRLLLEKKNKKATK